MTPEERAARRARRRHRNTEYDVRVGARDAKIAARGIKHEELMRFAPMDGADPVDESPYDDEPGSDDRYY